MERKQQHQNNTAEDNTIKDYHIKLQNPNINQQFKNDNEIDLEDDVKKQTKIQNETSLKFKQRGYYMFDVEDQQSSEQIDLSDDLSDYNDNDESSLNIIPNGDFNTENKKKYEEQLQEQVKKIQNQIKSYQDNPMKKKRRRCPMTEKALNKVIVLFQLFEKCQNSQSVSKYNMTLNIISDRLGYSYSTIYQLHKDYLFDSTLTSRFLKVRRGKDKAISNQLNQRRMDAIKSILTQNPFRTQNEVAIIMNQNEQLKKNGKQIQRRVVSRLLKSMKFSKKKIVKIPKFRNTAQNLQRRYHYCMKYKQFIDHNFKVYFLDQSAFNLFTIRDMAWSKKSQPVQHKIQFPKGKNVSLIAIMSQTGIVAWEVKNAFIEKFMTRMSAQKKQKKQYLIMDNCKIHDQIRTQQLSNNNVEIVCLPPYSPQLNPIQNWFHELKSRIRRTVFHNQQQLVNEIKKNIQFYKVYDFSNYFRCCMSHVQKGLLRQNF